MAVRSKTFRESYREEIKLFQTLWVKCWLAVFVLGLLAVPFVTDPYITYLVNISAIAVLGALGLNLLTGCTGQISLGHAAFMALGSYTAAILATSAGLPFWVTVPAAGLVSAGAGVLVGIPCLRLKGLYLAMATMAFGAVVEHLAIHWESLTRGVRGISMEPPAFLGLTFDTDEKFYYLILLITTLLLAAAKNILRTKVGRAFVAVRDRDIAAELMGVNLTYYKVLAFALSSFYVGIAGALYGYYTTYVHPEHFNLMLSVEFIAMIIVGGMGSVLGSVVGAVFITLVPEVLRFLSGWAGQVWPAVGESFSEEWNMAAFGLLIMVFLILEPGGIVAIWGRIKTSFKTWPFTY